MKRDPYSFWGGIFSLDAQVVAGNVEGFTDLPYY